MCMSFVCFFCLDYFSYCFILFIYLPIYLCICCASICCYVRGVASPKQHSYVQPRPASSLCRVLSIKSSRKRRQIDGRLPSGEDPALLPSHFGGLQSGLFRVRTHSIAPSIVGPPLTTGLVSTAWWRLFRSGRGFSENA